jgi:glucosamine--fructose-6-phosphate aminotransferase (isomerizing)
MSRSFLDGVLAQPDNLAQSASVVRAALAGPVGARAAAAVERGCLLAFGMGASAHAAAGFAASMRGTGRPALAVSAADLDTGSPAGLAAAYLAISQSGRSRETVEALAAAPAAGPSDAGSSTRLALTNEPDGPLGTLADVVLPLGCGADTRVSTLSYTATLQALGLLADRVTGRLSADWAALPALASEVLSREVDALVATLVDVDTVDVVGSGVHVATAGAVALLLREAVHLPAAGFATREYLHGPLETVGPRQAVLLFGSGREVPLAASLAGHGADVVLLTDVEIDEPAPHLRVFRLPPAPGLAGCVLDVLPVQLAAAAVAQRTGRAIELRHMPADTKLSANAEPRGVSMGPT